MSLLTKCRNYWGLDGNSTDIQGGNNGVDTNITYGAGKLDQCAEMPVSGVQNRITISALTLNPTVGYAVSFWYMPLGGTTPSNEFSIISEFLAGAGFYFGVGMIGNKIIYYDAFPDSNRLNNTAFTDNVWTHCVWNVSGNTGKWYINGVADSSDFTITATINPNVFGYSFPSYRNNCNLDSIGIFDSLTEAEITQLYNAGNGLEYPFTATANTSNFFNFF